MSNNLYGAKSITNSSFPKHFIFLNCSKLHWFFSPPPLCIPLFLFFHLICIVLYWVYFQYILKEDAMKMLHSICQQIWNTHQCPKDWKMSVFIPISKEMPKKSQTTTQVHSSHMLKILQADFNNTWIMNFQMFKLVLEKAEEPEIKLPTSSGSSKKQETSRKTSISALLTMPKPLTVWITINWGKFWKN